MPAAALAAAARAQPPLGGVAGLGRERGRRARASAVAMRATQLERGPRVQLPGARRAGAEASSAGARCGRRHVGVTGRGEGARLHTVSVVQTYPGSRPAFSPHGGRAGEESE